MRQLRGTYPANVQSEAFESCRPDIAYDLGHSLAAANQLVGILHGVDENYERLEYGQA